MREIVIISGKGGTGKTSVAASLAFITGDRAVMGDCDVDAADLHLILDPDILERDDFFSGVKAEIDQNTCNGCGKCHEVCRFDAVLIAGSTCRIEPLKCEGCGYCSYVCPVDAIDLKEQNIGECYISRTRAGSYMAHSRLGIGADNSGKLVTRVKRDARSLAEKTKNDYIIIDGSPGIGCPVIASLSGADFALMVTEPTRSGIHDLQRVWELSRNFKIPTGCLINKNDLNHQMSKEIETYLHNNGIRFLGAIPYDTDFHKALSRGQSVIEYNPERWKPFFRELWNKIRE